MVVWGQTKSENISLPVPVRVSKTRVLKLPICFMRALSVRAYAYNCLYRVAQSTYWEGPNPKRLGYLTKFDTFQSIFALYSTFLFASHEFFAQSYHILTLRRFENETDNYSNVHKLCTSFVRFLCFVHLQKSDWVCYCLHIFSGKLTHSVKNGDNTAMPCWWGLTRPKQLSMATTAGPGDMAVCMH